MTPTRFAATTLLLTTFCLVLPGCGGGDPRAPPPGKVTYKSKPLSGGTVFFVTEDGSKIESAPIGSDGTYSWNRVPLGKLKVGVEPPGKDPRSMMPKGAAKGAPPPNSPNYENKGGEY